MTPYVFHTITYYENNDGDIAYVSDVHTDEFVGTVVSNEDGVLEVENADDDDTFDITTNTALFYNGDEADGTKATDLLADKAEVVVVYDGDDDDAVLGIVAWEPQVKQVVQEYSSRRPLQLRVTAEYWDLPENDDGDLDLDALTIEGDADTLEDIAEDDVVHYYESNNTTKVKLVVVRDTFTGKFTRRVSSTEGTFGGQSFDVSVFSSVNLNNESLATTYELVLDKDGDIFSLTEYDEEPSVEGYALYVDFAKGTIETDEWDADDNSVDKAPRVKLFTDGGDVVVYALDTEDLTLEAEETLDLGDIVLEVNGDASEITATLTNGLEMGDLVKIELDDDGIVTDIDKVSYDATDGEFDADEMLVDEYDVTDTTVIFNVVVADDEDEWEVLEMSDLADGEDDLSYVVGDNFHADVITAYGELVAEDVNYAVITDFVEALDEDDEVVYELTLILNGETVTYLTTDDIEEDSDILEGVVTLDISSGKVEAINAITGTSITIEEISGRRIQYKDGDTTKVMTLDEDVVVFIQDGADRDDFEAGVVGDLVKGDEITVYGDGEAVLLDLGQYDN
jgi:formylmethanofuran dehydrogenase subunit D